LANFVNLTFTLIFNEAIRNDAPAIIKSIVDYLTLSIAIIIVAVPEGLPLAISLSLAYSVRRMKDDQILVKNLNSPEVMGTVEEICTGKTATLTANDMQVRHFYTQSKLIHNDRKNTLLNCELEQNTLELVKESILFNTETRIEMADNALYIPVGNGTEVGLVKFLQDAEVPVHEIIPRKLNKIVAQIPFSSDRKRSVVAMRHPDL
jgi:magnesium-transporting ATPase (P-type)